MRSVSLKGHVIVPGEVFVIDGGGDLDLGHIDLGGGGEEESLVHSAKCLSYEVIYVINFSGGINSVTDGRRNFLLL